MIIFLGDVHGEIASFDYLRDFVNDKDVIIQVGDLGLSASLVRRWKEKNSDYPCNVYFIDGNHEDFKIIRGLSKDEIEEVAPKLFYVPRGSVLTIQGKRIGFLGGGPSVDRAWRIEEISWFRDEFITNVNVDKLIENAGKDKLDVLVSHTPPRHVIAANFPKLDIEEWGLPYGWVDVCALKMETVHKLLEPKLHICGHMHRSIIDGSVRILDINESWMMPD